MKVLLLHNRYRQPGGEDRVAAVEAALLRRNGIQVVDPDFQNVVPSRNRLRQTFELVAQSAWSADSYERVRMLCEIHRPAVAHVHNFWLRMSPSVHAACRDAGVPTVQSLHNYRIACVNAVLLRKGSGCESCLGKVPWRGAVHRCYRNSFWASTAVAGMIVANRVRQTWTREAGAFVTPSDHTRGKLLASGLPPERTFVKPNCVDDPGDPVSAPSTSDYAVFVGRLSREKGVDVLLRAWVLSKLGAYRRLVIVGDGPERVELERLAGGLGLSFPAVTFTGGLAPEAAQKLVKNSRVLIAPSIWYETFGLVKSDRSVFARASGDRIPRRRTSRTRQSWKRRIEHPSNGRHRAERRPRSDPRKRSPDGHAGRQRPPDIPQAIHAAAELRGIDADLPLRHRAEWELGAHGAPRIRRRRLSFVSTTCASSATGGRGHVGRKRWIRNRVKTA